ncbi:MAG: hypothetical protein GC179_17605 [Anaerolineaceae bacterium]|nr:hypothetical protein [Anaerolineaceae bacterium]
MAATFDWDNAEKTRGRYELGQHWTWDEVNQVMAESWIQISKVDQIVDSIMISHSSSLPPNAMTHLRNLSQNRPSNTGIVVLVGASGFQRSMIQVFIALYSSTLRREVPLAFANSLSEAYMLLAKIKAKREASAPMP